MAQSGYIVKVLKPFGIEECRPVITQQALGNLLEPTEDGQPGVNDPNIPYRELVGCLQYLLQAGTRKCGSDTRKYMCKYTKDHFVMAMRVLCYLQGSCEYGLLWEKPDSPDLHFTAYADAELGSEKDDRRSITGFVLQMNGCTYVYKSHKKRIAHDNTCSIEFIAATESSVIIVWTLNLC
ncbi:LOW QUALITY PROTEIN: Copia type Polyprotein [Phytophthora megakarya]|uniref:Copia type Polyprotein n=1 Tax=Phytophthora megakarya TaxID=4795 RepID=A0A225UJY0_9STRA|nr:LOW QUALITY PROTEIN: Copia type Polyprotein [Phytophthora megakarya]